jgi:hypothetical protein
VGALDDDYLVIYPLLLDPDVAFPSGKWEVWACKYLQSSSLARSWASILDEEPPTTIITKGIGVTALKTSPYAIPPWTMWARR